MAIWSRSPSEVAISSPKEAAQKLPARAESHGKPHRPPKRGRRWTSFVADDSFPGRVARGLYEEANPSHRLRVEHDSYTLLIHLSDEDVGAGPRSPLIESLDCAP